MKKKRIYLSFPMKGRDVEEYTLQARADQEFLEDYGFKVLNPLDNGLPVDAPVEEHMRVDYCMLLTCDAIYLCKGWEYSHGCLNELMVASSARLKVISVDDFFESTDGYIGGFPEYLKSKGLL